MTVSTATTQQNRRSAWPANALDAAQRAFDLLAEPPDMLTLDGVDLPAGGGLHELKRFLIADATSGRTRDTVWRALLQRARSGEPQWVVAAVGLAMPGLRRKAGLLARGWHGDTGDLDAELLAGFLERLRTIDVGQPNLCQRLIDAGARAVRRSRRYSEHVDQVRVETAWSLPPRRPWDHPDWVLTRAVAAAVIGPEECLLISATRLDEVPLSVVADHLGISIGSARAWRRRAELRLATSIRSGGLDDAVTGLGHD